LTFYDTLLLSFLFRLHKSHLRSFHYFLLNRNRFFEESGCISLLKDLRLRFFDDLLVDNFVNNWFHLDGVFLNGLDHLFVLDFQLDGFGVLDTARTGKSNQKSCTNGNQNVR